MPEKKILFDKTESNVKLPNSNITGYESVYHVNFEKFSKILQRKHQIHGSKVKKQNIKNQMLLLLYKVAIIEIMVQLSLHQQRQRKEQKLN